MNLAWLHESLHHDVQSKSAKTSRPRKRFLHRSSGTPWSPDNPHRPLTNSSSNWEMNFLLHRNRSSPSSVSSSSSSVSSSVASASSTNHSVPNTSFMRKAHVLGDLIRHSTKVYSLTTVAIIAGIFVVVTVATAAIVALFWCKRNSVFAFKGSESEDLDECEMDEFDTDVEDAEGLLCRTSATEEEEEEDDDEEEEEDDYEEEEEEEDEERNDGRDTAAAGDGGLSSLSILSRSESMTQTSTCFPRAARTKVALRDRKGIFRGLKTFRFRSVDLVASTASADRLLQPSSLVSLLDHGRGQLTTLDHNGTDLQQQHRSGEAVVYSSTDEMTSQLVPDGDVSSDDDQATREGDGGPDGAASHSKAPAASPPRRPRFSGYRRLVVMATVEDETPAAAATTGTKHPLGAVLFQARKNSSRSSLSQS